MAIIANSTISENPIGVESIKSPDSDLRLEARAAVSKTQIIEDVAVLSLGTGILEVIAPFNVTDQTELRLSAESVVTVSRNYSEDLKVQQLSLGREDVVKANYQVTDTANLRLVGFERPDDDEPSERWREYPGLPIQPVGYSPIASEQFDSNFRSFSEIAEGSVEITAQDQIQVILNSIDSSLLEASDDAVFSSTNVYEDQGDLGVIGLDFTFNTTLNSFDQAPFEISDDALQSTLLNSIDQVNTSVIGFDQLSMSYFSFEEGRASIRGKTFAKEYTFLQQGFDIAAIRLGIGARSNEAYVEAREGVTSTSRQIWIG